METKASSLQCPHPIMMLVPTETAWGQGNRGNCTDMVAAGNTVFLSVDAVVELAQEWDVSWNQAKSFSGMDW